MTKSEGRTDPIEIAFNSEEGHRHSTSEPTRTAGISAPQQKSAMVWRVLYIKPLLLLLSCVGFVALLGVAQRSGFLPAGTSASSILSSAHGNTHFICPMMCTPPQAHPGRCPVCAMELVPTASSHSSDYRSIAIDPAARRIAGIRTVPAQRMPVSRTIRALGEIRYDESTLRTISAYVDGRLEKLYADYTGVVVRKGEHLALLYSPRLYSSQVELLLAKKAADEGRSSVLAGTGQSGKSLYATAKQRLVELGMTVSQVEELERAAVANSRLRLCAPSEGTVIEKLAVEGEYVKEGDVIYRLADLSNVWMILRVFPEDAAFLRFGQKVEAEVQSIPGHRFAGRISFIEPTVDGKTRTVGVRVVVPNSMGRLRVGDYARAFIDVPVKDDTTEQTYDAELANKWISPRHPHIIRDTPGECPICGVALVRSEDLGFVNVPMSNHHAVVVPRDAVLMVGRHNVVYVEASPGRFEIRNITLGELCGDVFVIQSGLREGEQVAVRGNFLIDSQMQLSGNPSLIDPEKVKPSNIDEESPNIKIAFDRLSLDDRSLAERQKLCPVTGSLLGSMGTPEKIEVNGRSVFICCGACRSKLLADAERYLRQIHDGSNAIPSADRVEPTPELPPITSPRLIEPSDVGRGRESPADKNDDQNSPSTPSAASGREVLQ